MEFLEGVLGRTGDEVRLRGGMEYGGIEGARPRLEPELGLCCMSIEGLAR